jgi:hypothetical protein
MIISLDSLIGSLMHLGQSLAKDLISMDYYPRSFTQGLVDRLMGPGKARFIIQPIVAIILGIRDGITDAKHGKPPYYIRILFTGEHKIDVLKASLRRVAVPLCIGIVLDMVLQWIMFRTVYLLPALMAGSILIALPYSITRGLSNRVARRWYKRKGATHPPGRLAH